MDNNEKNLCDGCQRGLNLNEVSMHVHGDLLVMVCTKEKYKKMPEKCKFDKYGCINAECKEHYPVISRQSIIKEMDAAEELEREENTYIGVIDEDFQATNCIFIGRNAGKKFKRGNQCIFLGDGAGEDEIEGDRIFILKFKDASIRHIMSDDDYDFISGILYAQIGVEPKNNKFLDSVRGLAKEANIKHE